MNKKNYRQELIENSFMRPDPSEFEEDFEYEKPKKQKQNRKKSWQMILIIITLLSLGLSGFSFYQFLNLKQNPAREMDKQTKEIIDQVGKLVILPQNEVPTIATVNDPEQLKDQPFFQNAKKGYKVLIYTNARKAILYDPIGNKIIEIAPISIGQEPQ